MSPTPLFSSVICAGFFSHFLAVSTFGGIVGSVVIRAQGIPSTRSLLITASFVSLFALLCRTVDASIPGSLADRMRRPPPLHHCFGIELFHSGLCLAFCTLHARFA